MPRIYLSPPDISALDHSSVSAVLTSNWVAPVGPHLNEFESGVAGRSGTKHAVALNSGTAALHLALKVLGVGAGDKVICPSLTFAASANPICYLGAEPIFVDSEPRTWNMDPTLLEQALEQEEGISAVIVVHLYGQCAEMDAILELCQRYKVPLIEDAAEALGASYRGRPAGSMGELSFFSFNGNKIITTSAGGMLVSDDEKLIKEAEYLATQAREPVAHYEHKAIGYNYRMSNVLAGLGISQLADLDRRIAVRRAHFEAYGESFSDLSGVVMMPISEEADPNYWLTCLTIDPEVAGTDRNKVIAALGDAGIEARPIWKPLHMQPVFEHSRAYGGACAERLYEHGMCLPSGSSLSEVDREEVIAIVRSCF
ncbi:MAG: aminotransferase class I/II-fold pyridoxal phosphate-dependent enzyme [Opitutales bacterium]|jgi:pyridoxal phosphate-dependent aminotransferase EpsN|nr:aminotransferase class I/II-fold pyridoxal phosphate-dependent enzyme [Opitutales bacterium]MDP4642963.1 aminotransferase class I/II-fold pyridoxal phosphate-dependent enzyme [Opitutales bacterium]MDP4694234.1 aminotransferase class I/II-fold pyridoxal phosphate-dependent enzyme [Opitutales bacterium]MDP4776531.1 aminotransferase class I/II-fold pyridoxal phosphate-dependent enzyme [Opitutales bacterium]MDP4884421.1 aminotransferase class I/II-fold pyridoxal phosphate-dependent enzyme [Opitu